MSKRLNSLFFKEDMQMADKHMQRSSMSVTTGEMQMKTIMKYHFTLIAMSITKKNNKCWKGCREIKTLINSWYECKIVKPIWKMAWRPERTTQFYSCVYTQKEKRFIAALFTTPNKWKQFRLSWKAEGINTRWYIHMLLVCFVFLTTQHHN